MNVYRYSFLLCNIPFLFSYECVSYIPFRRILALIKLKTRFTTFPTHRIVFNVLVAGSSSVGAGFREQHANTLVRIIKLQGSMLDWYLATMWLRVPRNSSRTCVRSQHSIPLLDYRIYEQKGLPCL